MIALLLALSAEPDLEAISRATQCHDACIEASVAKFIAPKEPADVIVSVALWAWLRKRISTVMLKRMISVQRGRWQILSQGVGED